VTGELAGDHDDLGRATLGVDRHQTGRLLGPQHREVGLGELVDGGQVQPDLEQLQRVGAVVLEQREHLGVDDAGPGGEPLRVAPPVAGRGAERVGVVDEPGPDVGDRLEAPVRVPGEPGHGRAVVHAPAVGAAEVVAEGAAGEGRVGAELRVPARVGVTVVHDEEERVERLPRRRQGEGLQHPVGRAGTLPAGRKLARASSGTRGPAAGPAC